MTAVVASSCSHRPLTFDDRTAETTGVDAGSDRDAAVGSDALADVPDASDGGIPSAIFPSLLVSVICDGIDSCCHQAAIPNNPLNCRGEMQNAFAHSPYARYNPDAAAACLAETVAYVKGCGGDSFFDWPGVLPAQRLLVACRTVFRETTPPGALCTRTDECDSSIEDYVCFPDSSGVGRCATPRSQYPLLHVGDRCGVSSGRGFCYSFCEPGSYCEVDGTCIPQRDAGGCIDACGATCSPTHAYCDPFQLTCRSRQVAGHNCSSDLECLTPELACVKGICVGAILRHCEP